MRTPSQLIALLVQDRSLTNALAQKMLHVYLAEFHVANTLSEIREAYLRLSETPMFCVEMRANLTKVVLRRTLLYFCVARCKELYPGPLPPLRLSSSERMPPGKMQDWLASSKTLMTHLNVSKNTKMATREMVSQLSKVCYFLFCALRLEPVNADIVWVQFWMWKEDTSGAVEWNHTLVRELVQLSRVFENASKELMYGQQLRCSES